MAKTNNHLVIMAGGVGSRFWPMSTSGITPEHLGGYQSEICSYR